MFRALFSCACTVMFAPRAAIAQKPSVDSSGMRGMIMPDTGMSGMKMPGTVGVPADRNSSGTAWIPDAVSEPMRHFVAGNWDLMLHGAAFAQYDNQGGPRGDSQLGVIDWAMLMATHDLDLVRRSNYRTIELNHGRVVFDSSESPASERPIEEPWEVRETPPDSTEQI